MCFIYRSEFGLLTAYSLGPSAVDPASIILEADSVTISSMNDCGTRQPVKAGKEGGDFVYW